MPLIPRTLSSIKPQLIKMNMPNTDYGLLKKKRTLLKNTYKRIIKKKLLQKKRKKHLNYRIRKNNSLVKKVLQSLMISSHIQRFLFKIIMLQLKSITTKLDIRTKVMKLMMKDKKLMLLQPKLQFLWLYLLPNR